MSDAPFIRCVRTTHGLQGASWFDQSRIERYGIGREIEVTLKQERSGKHHRYYWACLANIHENLPDRARFPKSEHLHDAIKMELGYVDTFVTLDGEVMQRPGSIAFDKMDQAEFKEFFDRAMDLIQSELMPGLDLTLLKRQAKAELGRTWEDAA